MKKVYTILTAMLMVFAYGNAQNASPNLESFEQDYFKECWASIDADGDAFGWESIYGLDDIVGHTGTGMAISASYDNTAGALTPENYLVLPKLSIQEGENLTYWVGAWDPAWSAEYYSVVLSTTGTAPADFTVTLFDETLTSADYSERNVDLSDYVGEEVYIAFKHFNITDQFVLAIDDVQYPTEVADCEQFVSVEETEEATAGIKAYPNPASDVINIEVTGLSNVSLEIVNSLGQVVETVKMNSSNSATIAVSNYQAGIYSARVVSENAITEERFIVK